MRLLGSGFSVTESTFAGTTAGAQEQGFTAVIGHKGMKVQKITAFCGGSSVAANTSGGIKFLYGQSSDAVTSTIIVLPTPQSANAISSAGVVTGMSVTLDGLNIDCSWFEAETNEAAAGGWGIFVFGD